MPALIDTNILVYRFDARFPEKQHIATELLRGEIRQRTLRLNTVDLLAPKPEARATFPN